MRSTTNSTRITSLPKRSYWASLHTLHPTACFNFCFSYCCSLKSPDFSPGTILQHCSQLQLAKLNCRKIDRTSKKRPRSCGFHFYPLASWLMSPLPRIGCIAENGLYYCQMHLVQNCSKLHFQLLSNHPKHSLNCMNLNYHQRQNVQINSNNGIKKCKTIVPSCIPLIVTT